MDSSYIAIDLGAGSGRVILGTIGSSSIQIETIHRFPNSFRKKDRHDRWDINSLWSEILVGLGKVGAKVSKEKINLKSIGADTWGVDFGLFDEQGKLIEEPIAYRDSRTQGIMEEVFSIIPDKKLYGLTGIQFMPFNTIFQLYAQKKANEWPTNARLFLMIPDIIHYYLSGKMAGEYTNASTSQLLNVTTREWEKSTFDALKLDSKVAPCILSCGSVLGRIASDVKIDTGLPDIKVVLPATHDTGSAVAGTPLQDGWAYISSGTWSLVGIESSKPFTSDKAYKYNFTNEGGVFNTIRFLKNVMGLWILESCRKEWQAQKILIDYDSLVQRMEKLEDTSIYINPEYNGFLNPKSMLAAITHHLKETGQKYDWNQIELSAIILRSLAMKYACVIEEIEEITESSIKGIHIVGGGSQNKYLNQLTADVSGKPVLAGPIEATAIGNIIIQAISDGRFKDIAEARNFLRQSVELISYSPMRQGSMKLEMERFKEICKNR